MKNNNLTEREKQILMCLIGLKQNEYQAKIWKLEIEAQNRPFTEAEDNIHINNHRIICELDILTEKLQNLGII